MRLLSNKCLKNWFICLLFDLLHQINVLCVVVEISIRGGALLPSAGARSKKKNYTCARVYQQWRSRVVPAYPPRGARIRSRVVPGRSRPWRAGRRERIGGHGSFPPARAPHACLHKQYLCARLRKLYLCARIRKLYLCAHLSTSEVTCRSRLLARARGPRGRARAPPGGARQQAGTTRDLRC